MTGPDLQDGYVVGAAIGFQLLLSWYLLGPELAFILAATTALGIALNQTPSPKPRRVLSRTNSQPSASLLSRSVSEGVTVRRKREAIRPIVVVTPDSQGLFQPLPRKNYKTLGARNLSRNFVEAL